MKSRVFSLARTDLFSLYSLATDGSVHKRRTRALGFMEVAFSKDLAKSIEI